MSRRSLPEGTITYRDLLKVQPFGNAITTVRLKGSELFAWLAAAAKMTPGSGGFAQTAGVQMRIDSGELKEVRLQGSALDPLRDYTLCINRFTAIGGDGYPRLDQHPGYLDTGLIDVDVMREYIAKRSPIKAADYAPAGEVQRH